MTPIFDAGLRVSSLPALLVAVVMLTAPLAAFGTVPGVPVVPVSTGSEFRDLDLPEPAVAGPVSTDVLELAFSAASCAVRAGSVQSPATLTVIDYSKPSTEKRLWVFDMRTRAVLYEELVAHGMGTGDNMASSFSNEPDSHKTSLGLFVTEGTYVGKNGYSLRLNGLDEGFNDRARERAIVMHGAPYVSAAFAQAQGRLGRSWGCPALREAVAREVIDRVKGGNLVFAYYPDAQWLKTSQYLGDCAAAS
jgi:hypothetical protein